MQKLPEAPDKKRGWRMRKEKEQSQQKKESRSLFSKDQRSDNIEIFIATDGRRHGPSWDDA